MTRELEHSCVWPLRGLPPHTNPSASSRFGSWGMSPWSHRPIQRSCQLWLPTLKEKTPSEPDIPLTMGLCYSLFSTFHQGGMCCFSPVVVFHSGLFFYIAGIVFCSRCAMGAATRRPPPAIFEAFCVLISYCLLQLPVCYVEAHLSSLKASWESLMSMTFAVVTLPKLGTE